MSLRDEQCNKVCRILDDVLANRPTERDALIMAVKTAMERLASMTWIPCSERLPKEDQEVLATTNWGDVTYAWRYDNNKWFIHEGNTNAMTDDILAWMPLPECYRGENDG